MSHPYVELLRHGRIRVLWAGLALSALGSEVYRIGALWLAAELAGAKASLLVTAEAAAVVAVSVLLGPAVESLPRRRFLVGAELVSAGVAAGVVGGALLTGLTLPVLIVASVTLAALGATVRPVVLSSLPQVAPGRIREVNGLFDSTLRLAQAAGPMLAAVVLKILPAIHLLTINAASFLASAAAWMLVGRRLGVGVPAVARGADFLQRLGRGVHAANGCAGIWSVLIATGVRGGAYALGFTIAIPVLFAAQDGPGLAGVALVFGATAIVEIVSTPLLVLNHPSRPLMRLFHGYALIGAGLTAMGLAAALPADGQLVAMCAAAAVIGLGNSAATLQITTFFASRLTADDYAAVLRLRLVTIIGSVMAASAAGPLVLPWLGPAATILGCGLAATAVAVLGARGRPARTLGPDFLPRQG